MEDVFKKAYRPLTEAEISLCEDVKDHAQTLYDLFDQNIANREMALAKTNLEQAVMWAIKAITK